MICPLSGAPCFHFGCHQKPHSDQCQFRSLSQSEQAALLADPAVKRSDNTARPPHADELVMTGHLNSHTGYGIHFREEVHGLHDLGYRVAVDPVDRDDKFLPADPWLLERIVGFQEGRSRFVTKAAGSLDLRPQDTLGNVILTMWETDQLHERSVQLLNMARGVIVPCWWNYHVFRNSGVTVPIDVVPFGFDPKIYKPRGSRPGSGEGFVFLAAGRLMHGGTRKGVEDVIAAFRAEFCEPAGDDVSLIVKLWPDCEIDEPADDRIHFDRRPLSDWELADLYRLADVFVSASKGEGWGFHPLQALACGTPVISPCVGGPAEYLRSSINYFVDYDWKSVDPANKTYVNHGRWSVPRIGSLREQMRRVYSDREELGSKAEHAHLSVAYFTWRNHCEQLARVLIRYGLLPDQSTVTTWAKVDTCPHASGTCGCGGGPPRQCSRYDRPAEVRNWQCFDCQAGFW